jgi:hypothetical protein
MRRPPVNVRSSFFGTAEGGRSSEAGAGLRRSMGRAMTSCFLNDAVSVFTEFGIDRAQTGAFSGEPFLLKVLTQVI